jgi:hypothetical protein
MFDVNYAPFKKKIANYMEVFNELCFLFLTFNFYLFTDYNRYTTMRWDAGWNAVSLILFNILINLIVILVA